MICVFDVIEGPARGKRFWLRANQRMAVGRISTADFPVPADAHMSRHHLILEANCDIVRLRDVGSANGTFVNESRINSLELHPGDKIRAGSTIIELSVLDDHEDPHSKDGLTVATLTGGSLPGMRTVQPRGFQTQSSPEQTVSRTLPEPSGNPPGAVMEAEQLAGRTVGTRVVRLPGANDSGIYSANQRESLHDGDSTLRLNVQWWMPFFQPTTAAGYFESKQVPGEGPTLLNALRSAPAAGRPIALVVNQSQLGRQALDTLRSAIDSRLVTPLSHALLLVRFDASDGVWQLVERSARQDAVTCICARKSLDLSWLNELLDQLSYPSMLASLLKSDDRSLKSRLQKHVAFAVFEKSRTGGLAMYMSDDYVKASAANQAG